MPPVAIAAIIALASGTASLVWLVAAGPGRQARAIRSNLQRGFDTRGLVGAGRRSRPSTLAVSLGRSVIGRGLARLIRQAGRPDTWPLERVINAKLLAGAVGIALGALFVWRLGTLQSIAIAVVLTVGGFYLPDLLLYNTAIKRRQAIALQLPDTLDQTSIAVEAGLGFDAALVRVARNGKGELAAELVRTLQDIQVGQPRRTAFEALSERVAVPELRRFLRAVVQAEEYGIALADVLHTQAGEMRIMRRQRAERKAMEIPVKVTLPLILCILPVLFIVIMGPAAIKIIAAFT